MTSASRLFAVLLSGGSGSRMGLDYPKQFLEISGEPVLYWSLMRFLSLSILEALVLVVHPEHQAESEIILKRAADRANFRKTVRVVSGGNSRHSSTLAGIEPLESMAVDSDLVLIHDAARPLVQEKEILELTKGTDQNHPVTSLALPMSDTIVEGSSLPGFLEKELDRNRLYSIKTPQAALWSILKELKKIPEKPEFTDLLTWAREGKIQGFLLPASPYNIKLTHPADLPLFEFYFGVTGMQST